MYSLAENLLLVPTYHTYDADYSLMVDLPDANNALTTPLLLPSFETDGAPGLVEWVAYRNGSGFSLSRMPERDERGNFIANVECIKDYWQYLEIDKDRRDDFMAGAVYDNREGSIAFTIATRFGNERSRWIHPRKAFKRIVSHFSANNPRYICGNWLYGVNLATFNRLTSPPHNLSHEEAARKTWTGRMAAKQGFTRVLVKSTNYDSVAKKYDAVFVEFYRPK